MILLRITALEMAGEELVKKQKPKKPKANYRAVLFEKREAELYSLTVGLKCKSIN